MPASPRVKSIGVANGLPTVDTGTPDGPSAVPPIAGSIAACKTLFCAIVPAGAIVPANVGAGAGGVSGNI